MTYILFLSLEFLSFAQAKCLFLFPSEKFGFHLFHSWRKCVSHLSIYLNVFVPQIEFLTKSSKINQEPFEEIYILWTSK